MAGIVAVFAIGTDEPALIDVAIALALVAFIGAVAFARYAERESDHDTDMLGDDRGGPGRRLRAS